MTGIIFVKFFFDFFNFTTKFQRLLDVMFPPFFLFDWIDDQFVSVIKSEAKQYHNCAESNRKYKCATQRHVVSFSQSESKRGKFHFRPQSQKSRTLYICSRWPSTSVDILRFCLLFTRISPRLFFIFPNW